MKSKMEKLANQEEFELANEVKKRISNLKKLHEERSINSKLVSLDVFACISKLGKTGVCILSVREGKIRGTKTHYLNENLLEEVDHLIQSLIFNYYQSLLTLPEKIILTIQPNNVNLIEEAVKLKFNKDIVISTRIPNDAKKLVNLAKLNANQIIDNRLNQSE